MVLLFFEALNKFEAKFSDYSTSIIFGIIYLLITGIFISVSRKYLDNLTNLEIIFIVFLISFLINYYLIRSAKILPYIEDD